MATVGGIATAAFDAVAASITDAIKAASFGGDAARLVFDMERVGAGFPSPEPQGRVDSIYAEGLASAPAEGDTFTVGAVTYYVLGVKDILGAGGLYHLQAAAEANLLWKTVAIQAVTEIDDGAGGFTTSWATTATVSGGMVAMSGNERFTSARTEAVSMWRLLLPYQSGLTAKNRVLIDGIAYNVSFVNDVQKRGVWHVLDLDEGVAT